MAGTRLSYVHSLRPRTTALLTVTGLRKSYRSRAGQATAVDSISLAVEAGQVLSLLGPARAGKSVALSLIAGRERPDAGRIQLSGHDVPRGRHDIGHVATGFGFTARQSVREVMTAALRTGGSGRRGLDDELATVLARLTFDGDPDARVAELPAREQLLVAIGREAVAGARVLLLDEPLEPVERPLRDQAQDDILALRQEFGLTLVIATRNPRQAMNLSERVAVMINGRLEQTGAPIEVYERPATEEVAALGGAVNLLGPAASVQLLNQTATFSVRPEKIRIVETGYEAAPDEVLAIGTVLTVVYGGATTRITIQLDADAAVIRVLRMNSAAPEDLPASPGQRVTLIWPRRDATRFV
ncbi:ATP-binding cassette domain-containing protein [Kineosporia succinea]|uniref:Spermidine/putrescine transport system ATP-binding protein n=1 Tax=Kineosporia succinea TaxID=84632 RepID=A0ABT9P2E0_9ACTN|nr:ABC transporter ATP-binding protein [Kineosporia succinea]MDP9826667.1 putative spermidine/putrescine transport system ATP-binding protein [Kineosporia succinea]